MNVLLIFVLVSVISFIGSLQLGAVNTMVIKTVVNQNLKAGLSVAIGGSLPEMFYAILAIWASGFIQTSLYFYLEILVVPIFLLLGLMLWFSKTKSLEISDKNQSNGFFVGFGLGMLNPQLLPFWFSILVYLESLGLSVNKDLWHQIAFIIGTTFGAFVLLAAVALFIHYKQSFVKYLQKVNLNKVIGIIFIGLALIQSINLLRKF